MSNALAIAAVTATLEYCLNLVYNHPSAVLGGVSVSALAPDIAQTNFATGSSSQLHVNLFLHAGFAECGLAQCRPAVAGRRWQHPARRTHRWLWICITC